MDKVVHFEIPTDDLARAKKFYQDTFGWQLQDMPEMNYVIARTVDTDEKQMPKEPGAINGGMFARSAMNPATAPTFSINVENIDDAIQKVKSAGGTILNDKITVGTMGFMAYFKDTEGNVMSVWQNA